LFTNMGNFVSEIHIIILDKHHPSKFISDIAMGLGSIPVT